MAFHGFHREGRTEQEAARWAAGRPNSRLRELSMEPVINAVIEMLSAQGHTVRTQESKGAQRFEIDGYTVTRRQVMDLINGTYSIEDLQEQLRKEHKQSR